MRRLLPMFLVVAACSVPGGGESGPTTAGEASTAVTEAPAETTPDEATQTTQGAADTTPATSDRPAAPDFSLPLADGGTYTLSEGSKPVYMVFWAEW